MTAKARLPRAPFILAVALAVAGCGNSAERSDSGSLAVGMVRNLVGGISAGRTAAAEPAAAPTPDQIAAEALDSFAGPLMLVVLESQGATTVMGLYGENGNMRTYALPSEQSIILRDGILAGTRGFGFDVMSADTDAVAALILARKEGVAAKVQRYLDADNVERPLPMECTVSRGEASEFEIAGKRYSGTQMVEVCSFQGQAVGSGYLVSAAGAVLASRQWIGPELGYVTLQVLRP
ncbi:MAG: YjbF family lipoprotein [Rhodobacteraceae bacterium]|nr:YjbF family lipoprotein [Paracoccaceae bacterium]